VSTLEVGVALLFVLGAANHPSTTDTLDVPIPPAGDYLSRPVFYERYPASNRPEDLELLRHGKVRLPHYEPVDIAKNYDWSRNTHVEQTWWMQMQELRFLLPAIASDTPEDRALTRGYLVRWFRVHMIPKPQHRAWGEPMAVAYRAMVFVYYLKRESGRSEPDPDVVGLLQAAILAHQEYLGGPGDFDENSNHAFIDALGLLETTRVYADRRAIATALNRLMAMLDRAVTPVGIEREQSPYYHFVVTLWTEQTVDYLNSLPSVPRAPVKHLAGCAPRMRVAAYFLQDHDGGIPQIGDGDSVGVDAFGANYRIEAAPSAATTLYDPNAGYAIYKGEAAQGDYRYVIFRNPNSTIRMPNHMHDDVLSVYFSFAGETILGDSGRYSYATGPQRNYVRSPCAHNTIVAAASLTQTPHPPRTRPARSVRDRSTAGTQRWFASLRTTGSECRRTVLIPERANTVSVVDSILPVREGAEPEELAWIWNVGHDVIETKASVPEQRDGGEWMLATRRGERVRVRVVVTGAGAPPLAVQELIRGQEQPRLGWYSPSQGVLRPATAIVVRARRDRLLVVRTDVEVIGKRAPRGE
jgi:hypothetical protein